MKTIGLLGGMSWESSAEYYRLINQNIRNRMGGLHSAKIVMISLDFAEIAKLQSSGCWDEAGSCLARAAKQAESAGAEVLLICTNTMHKVFDAVKSAVNIPILHIADATAEHVKQRRIEKVLLLGTRFTMEDGFFVNHMHTLRVQCVVPNDSDRKIVHSVIFNELVQGILQENSKKEFLRIINAAKNIGGVILGCTEIGLLIRQTDVELPIFDTTRIHADLAVQLAL